MLDIHPLILDPSHILGTPLDLEEAALKMASSFDEDGAAHSPACLFSYHFPEFFSVLCLLLEAGADSIHIMKADDLVSPLLLEDQPLKDRFVLAEMLYKITTRPKHIGDLNTALMSAAKRIFSKGFAATFHGERLQVAYTANLMLFYADPQWPEKNPDPKNIAPDRAGLVPDLGAAIGDALPAGHRVLPAFLYRQSSLTAHQRIGRQAALESELKILEHVALQRPFEDQAARFADPIMMPAYTPAPA